MRNRWKKVLAWLLLFAMIFSSDAISVLAAEVLPEANQALPPGEIESQVLESGTEQTEQTVTVKEGTDSLAALSDEQTLRGEGTEDQPYLIASEAELALIAEMGKAASLIGYFRLETDITLTEEWTPIGVNSSNAFRGIFDGQGHTVSGFSISEGTGPMGLFGCNAGTVKNLTVNGTVAGSGTGGILAGENTGRIENCHVSGSVESSGTHGGLVGRNSPAE